MSRDKRLYRVTAVYEDETGERRRTWHYQDKRAAETRLQHCRDGRTEVWISESTNEPVGFVEQPATSVTMTRSLPVIWEDEPVSTGSVSAAIGGAE